MSGLVEQIVAQLRAAANELDSAAAATHRVGADAQQGHALLTAAGQGSDHRDIRAAVDSSQIAAAKVGKVERLLAEAANHLNAYANHIAPGSAPEKQAAESAMPSGEELLQEAARRSETHRGAQGFFSKMTRNIEDIQDTGKSVTEAAENVFKVTMHKAGPSGGHSTGTTTPSVQQPDTTNKIDVPGTAGSLIVIGVVVGIAVHKTGRMAREYLTKRWRDAGQAGAD
ncbi:hypothetical protein [Micromonospora zhanjiangensis]|uniref:Uncharacterized protein n=1 Tax=Micromonospora zhanjiangensis TaxID=1522057 RepID=A0ABV8KMW8_9ACTN